MLKPLTKRLRSRTYWLGIATLLLGALETAQATGVLPEMFSPNAKAAVTIGVAVLIFILRELTTKPVGDKDA